MWQCLMKWKMHNLLLLYSYLKSPIHCKESDIYNAVFKEEFFDKTGKLVDRRTIFKLGDSVW